MTTTPNPGEAPGNHDEGPRVTRDEVRDLGRLRRTSSASPQGRHIGGVAGGLARHFDIDPIVIRIVMVVLLFFGGSGLVMYIAGWLFIPDEDTNDAVINVDERSRSMVYYLTAGVAAVLALGDTITGNFDLGWIIFPVVIVGAVLLLANNGVLGSRAASATRGSTQGAPTPASTPTPASGAVPMSDGDSTHLAQTLADQAVAGTGEPTTPVPAAPEPPRNPRRRGPLLFWWTLGLVAVALGTLGIADAAGVAVADPAYPGLALGIIGAMLVLGSFWGRGGGLILVGLLTTVGLVGSVAAQEWEHETVTHTPTSADAVTDYDFDAARDGRGEYILDLTEVSDLENLDGESITLDGDVGRIEVIVPNELGIVGELNMEGPGGLEAFDESTGGIDITLDMDHQGTEDITLDLDAKLAVGEISVRSER